MQDFPTLLYTSTCKIPTLLNTLEACKKVPLSGRASLYKEYSPRAIMVMFAALRQNSVKIITTYSHLYKKCSQTFKMKIF